jgi:hypothetical protein
MEDESKGISITALLALVVVVFLLLALGFVLGRFSVDSTQLAPSIVPTTPPNPVATAELILPEMDVPGTDVPGLPRYPNARRVESRQVIVGDLLETEVEYVLSGELEAVHDFYRDVFDAEGWTVADLGIYEGEWTFFVIDGDREARVELEARGSLVEIEIELSEPMPPEAGNDAQP